MQQQKNNKPWIWATQNGEPKHNNYLWIGHHDTWTPTWPFQKWRWNGLLTLDSFSLFFYPGLHVCMGYGLGVVRL
jgi:hypothetical protein